MTSRPTPNGLYLKEAYGALYREVRRRRRFVLLVRRAPLRLDAEPTATEAATWMHVAYCLLVVGGAIVAALIFGESP